MLEYEVSAQMATWLDGFSGIWYLLCLLSCRVRTVLKTEASNIVYTAKG